MYYGAEDSGSTAELPLSEVGHYLFFDPDLSANGQISCASCHDPNLAFTDGYRKSVNSYGDVVQHNAPSLLNLDNNNYFNWSSPEVHYISQQVLGPLSSNDPEEMGTAKALETVRDRLLKKDYLSQRSDLSAGGKDDFMTFVQCALDAYITDLSARSSKYDEKLELTPLQVQGRDLFFEKYLCNTCHGGPDFDQSADPTLTFLEDVDGKSFRVPTLRNVSLTRPYFHDGRFTKISEAISQHFDTYSDYTQMARPTPEENTALISFLETFTDTSYLTNPYFLAPK